MVSMKGAVYLIKFTVCPSKDSCGNKKMDFGREPLFDDNKTQTIL